MVYDTLHRTSSFSYEGQLCYAMSPGIGNTVFIREAYLHLSRLFLPCGSLEASPSCRRRTL